MCPTPASPDSPSGFDAADAAFAAVFAAIAVWSWVGIGLAEAGRFYLAELIVLAGPASLLAAALAWRALRAGRQARTGRLAVAALVGVIAAASWIGARPGEYLVDGTDGSVYLNIGRAISRHHGLTYREPLLDLLPPDQWPSVFARERSAPRIFNLFPGGIQMYPGSTTIRPNFFHLFPVWVALADVLAGPTAAYFVSPMFGVVAVTAFWLLVRALTAPLAATLASLLLLMNFAQIWFARMPTTEIMTQAFVLSGLYFATVCHRHPAPVLGVLGAMAFGLAAFVRIDVVILVLPTVAVFLALIAVEGRWHRAWTWCAIVLAVVTAHAGAHAWLTSGVYTERILFHSFQGRSVSSGSRARPTLVLISGAFALLASRWPGTPRVAGRLVWLVFVGVLAHTTFLILPHLREGFLLVVVSPAGVVLTLVAVAVWLTGDRSAPTVFVVGVLLGSAIVYGESARDSAELPMVLRRFVPTVLPLATLAIGVLIDRVWRLGLAGRVAGVSVWIAMALLWLAPSRPILAAAPMQGVHDQFSRLAADLPPDAIIIADGTAPSHFALSLHASFRRDVLSVTWTANTARVLDTLAHTTSRPLFIVQGDVPAQSVLTARDVIGLELTASRTASLRTRQLAAAADRMPSTFVERASAIQFYRARPRTPQVGPVTVEIGAADLAGRIVGFHEAEQMGEASARWTHEVARMQLPRVQGATGVLVLRLAAPRPASVAPARVQLSLDGVEFSTTPPLGPGFSLIEVPLPGWALARLGAGSSELTLASPTFVPAEHGMGADGRQLGAVVDWVRVEAR